jgi:hypothetical protein
VRDQLSGDEKTEAKGLLAHDEHIILMIKKSSKIKKYQKGQLQKKILQISLIVVPYIKYDSRNSHDYYLKMMTVRCLRRMLLWLCSYRLTTKKF